MKVGVIALLFVFCYVECKKTYAPLDKNANVAFINMEGGGIKPAPRPAVPAPAATPVPAKLPTQPAPTRPAPVTQAPAKPAQPPTAAPAKPATPPQPNQAQIKPVPVNPAPVAKPGPTPGPGSVQDLVNFYNSQGKASPIRPYSYSQAVRQG